MQCLDKCPFDKDQATLEQGLEIFFWKRSMQSLYRITISQDGFITMGEALGMNITIEGFNSVDLDKDGIIVPGEIDESLVIFWSLKFGIGSSLE